MPESVRRSVSTWSASPARVYQIPLVPLQASWQEIVLVIDHVAQIDRSARRQIPSLDGVPPQLNRDPVEILVLLANTLEKNTLLKHISTSCVNLLR